MISLPPSVWTKNMTIPELAICPGAFWSPVWPRCSVNNLHSRRLPSRDLGVCLFGTKIPRDETQPKGLEDHWSSAFFLLGIMSHTTWAQWPVPIFQALLRRMRCFVNWVIPAWISQHILRFCQWFEVNVQRTFKTREVDVKSHCGTFYTNVLLYQI